MGGSGVQRPLKFAKYLPAAGWDAEVLCAGHPHYPLQDASLLGELPADTRIHRVAGFEPGGAAARAGSLFSRAVSDERARRWEAAIAWRMEALTRATLIPEPELLWVPSATRAAMRLARGGAFDAVLSSGPPHACHLVASAVSRIRDLPWIADLRDPIVGNWAGSASGYMARRWGMHLECGVVRRASGILVTCPEAETALRSRHPRSLGHRVRFVPNGYDAMDAPPTAAPRGDSRFRVAHIGSFYRDQSIAPYLQACRLVLERNPALTGVLEFRAVGAIAASQRGSIESADGRFFKETGYLNHREALKEVAAADMVLLTTPDHPLGHTCIPAKTFEYLAFGRHVLGIVHADSTLRRILESSGNSTCLVERAPEAIAAAMEHCYCRWERNELNPPRDVEFVEQFRRDRQARMLADLLDACCGGSPALACATLAGQVAGVPA